MVLGSPSLIKATGRIHSRVFLQNEKYEYAINFDERIREIENNNKINKKN